MASVGGLAFFSIIRGVVREEIWDNDFEPPSDQRKGIQGCEGERGGRVIWVHKVVLASPTSNPGPLSQHVQVYSRESGPIYDSNASREVGAMSSSQ